ncbi:MAG: tetratricopeptide repeat protein [Nitrospirae bacterium]|nr:tetratricopeptide repeat protein [Nitrospirota bacterium]
MEAKNYLVAIAEFESALKDVPGDFTATLYLGIARSSAGDREAETTLKKALAMKPGDSRASLELGIYYFNKGEYNLAEDYFNRTIAAAPDTDLSEAAKEYLSIAATGGTAKPWMLNISLGTQYDSNVVLNGSDSPLPQGISGESDWRAVLYLKGRYNIVTKENLEGSIGYSLYQSLHGKLSDFNVTQHLLELKAAYNISPSLNLSGTYSFEYVNLGGDNYDYAHSVTPSLVISEAKGFSTIIEYRYRDIHFKDSDRFVNNSDRTGSNNLIGITQNIPVSHFISAKVGYSHDEDSTREDFWDYKGDKAFMGIRVKMPHSVFLDLYGEYYNKEYEGVNPVSNSKRKDIVHTYSGTATKALTDRLSITVGQSYTRNKSNIFEYDYNRSITSLFLNARF